MRANRDFVKEKAKADGGGRGAIARKAEELWSRMSPEDKAPWETKFQEHRAAFNAYKLSAQGPPAKRARKAANSSRMDWTNVAGLGPEVVLHQAEVRKFAELFDWSEIRKLGHSGPAVLSSLRAAGGKPHVAKRYLLEASVCEDFSEIQPTFSLPQHRYTDNKLEYVLADDEAMSRPRVRTMAHHAWPAPATVDVDPEVRAEADRLGMTNAFIKLAARPDVIGMGRDARDVLNALQDHRGFVQPAKRALLAVGDRRSDR